MNLPSMNANKLKLFTGMIFKLRLYLVEVMNHKENSILFIWYESSKEVMNLSSH